MVIIDAKKATTDMVMSDSQGRPRDLNSNEGHREGHKRSREKLITAESRVMTRPVKSEKVGGDSIFMYVSGRENLPSTLAQIGPKWDKSGIFL